MKKKKLLCLYQKIGKICRSPKTSRNQNSKLKPIPEQHWHTEKESKTKRSTKIRKKKKKADTQNLTKKKTPSKISNI